VFNDYGEVFLQKRVQTKEVDPGLWDSSAAGHVDYGESYDDCAVRELAEELRIGGGYVPESLFKLEASEQTGWEFVQVYRIRWNGLIDPNPEEISVGAWFSPNELEGWMDSRPEEFTGFFRSLWPLYRSRCP
jgi:isopentenyldiphosphate isomerase